MTDRDRSAKLIEHVAFDKTTRPLSRKSEAAVFRCVTFQDVSLEGYNVLEALIGCTLERVEWYWGMFNTAIVARTSFSDCVFRGTAFAGSQFIASTFTRCRFEKDNLDGTCTFDDCLFAECRFEACHFAPETRPKLEPLFNRTRFYSCNEIGTTGVEKLF